MGKSREEIMQLILQLREKLKDVIEAEHTFDNHFYLYRWLLQNRFKVEQTEKVIRESIPWRLENNVNELAKGNWAFWAPGLQKEMHFEVGGCTKQGQPIITIMAEELDLRKVIQKYGKDSLLRYTIQMYAKLEQLLIDSFKENWNKILMKNCSETQSRMSADIFDNGGSLTYDPSWNSCGSVVIGNYKNYSLWNATSLDAIQYTVEMAKIGMNYFPAHSCSIYMINLNKFANVALNMLKPLLNMESMNLEFFDTDKSKWSRELLKHIDKDQLHPALGGTQKSE